MSTILRSGPYRLYFFSHEPGEPPHIHVDREDRSAKFWLEPVSLARNRGFRPWEITRIRRIVEECLPRLRRAWNEHTDGPAG